MEGENTDETQVLETGSGEEGTDETFSETTDNTEALKKEIEDLKKKQAQLFERFKKSETKETPIEKPKSDELSLTDAVFLMENGIKSQHFADVIQASKVLNISISEAVKNPVVKTILAQKVEEETTASATMTKAPTRGVSKINPEEILNQFESGKVPETDAEFDSLAKARMFKGSHQKSR